MKTILCLIGMVVIAGCATRQPPNEAMVPASIGIVNHTGSYIYSASIDGQGGANMGRWGAGHGDICCTSIPSVWHPGVNVLVRWDMPEGHEHIVKEKMVEVEKYNEPGDIYMHFFPNGEIRVVVSNWAGYGRGHPIVPPVKPGNAAKEKSTRK